MLQPPKLHCEQIVMKEMIPQLEFSMYDCTLRALTVLATVFTVQRNRGRNKLTFTVGLLRSLYPWAKRGKKSN